MLLGIFRVLLGITAACLVAGAVQVVFAYTPSELAVAGSDRWQIAGIKTLESATAAALIAAPLLLLSGIYSEILTARSFAFHVIVGVLIGLAGFIIVYAGEVQNEPTIANSYGIATFLTTGFLGGITYWLLSGRFAGRRRTRIANVQERGAIVRSTTRTTEVTRAGSVNTDQPTTSAPASS